MLTKSEVGRLGERLAAEFLKKRGFKILCQNWRSPRWGEIDIVAVDGETLVMVEVKTRSHGEFSQPFEAVDFYKKRTLVRAAYQFKQQHPQTPNALRLDVVSVVLETPPAIEYFADVYQPL